MDAAADGQLRVTAAERAAFERSLQLANREGKTNETKAPAEVREAIKKGGKK